MRSYTFQHKATVNVAFAFKEHIISKDRKSRPFFLEYVVESNRSANGIGTSDNLICVARDLE